MSFFIITISVHLNTNYESIASKPELVRLKITTITRKGKINVMGTKPIL